jgi:CubicO group peptidase (beta-lactamase class C family)
LLPLPLAAARQPYVIWTVEPSTRTLPAARFHVTIMRWDGPVRPSDSSRRQALGDAALDAIDPHGPGCVAAVGSEGAVLWSGARGIADLDAGTPLTTDTVFDIGSVSKQFTATAVLLLAVDGRLSLADPIARYLGGLPPWGAEITIGDLMRNVSGVPDYGDRLLAAGHDWADAVSHEQTLDTIWAMSDLDFPPRTGWAYSSTNFVLLGEIVTRLSGQPLPTFLRENVFEPLRLDMTLNPIGPVAGRAVPYLHDDDGTLVEFRSGWVQYGDGFVQTTPRELVRWADVYRTGQIGTRNVGGLQFAGAATVPAGADGAEWALGNDDHGEFRGSPIGAEYGAGMFRLADGRLSHSGWWGHGSYLEVSADRRLAVAVCCNVETYSMRATAEQLAAVARRSS